MLLVKNSHYIYLLVKIFVDSSKDLHPSSPVRMYLDGIHKNGKFVSTVMDDIERRKKIIRILR